jgi:hypothetical protein
MTRSIMRDMNDDTLRQAKLAALREEIEANRFANKLYWDQKGHSHDADVEHQRRQERLEQVRKKMDELGRTT